MDTSSHTFTGPASGRCIICQALLGEHEERADD